MCSKHTPATPDPQPSPFTPAFDLARIIESARRLGVELDEPEALQWLAAMAASQAGDQITIDEQSGVFGHRITMLDFSPAELEYFRQIGRIVGFNDRPGVETALALSGSSAQSGIQTYPGDCDYFERVNIHAPSREEACRTLAGLIHEKALSTIKGPNYMLIEVKFGSYPVDVVRGDVLRKRGTPVSWTPGELEAGRFEARLPEGEPVTIGWEDVMMEPGWCKLDWVVADHVRGQLANASNMLDVTWEAPDGTITPLDGYLDPYFQEVYLEAESIPIFSKLVRHVSSDALGDYVAQLEKEVRKYLYSNEPNYGKAAKRMYNIFRLTGRYEEAAFIRELFDEPATVLYQVWSLIRTLDDACQPGSTISMDDVLAQADRLVLQVVQALEGEQEVEVVRSLQHLRNSLLRQEQGEARTSEVEGARTQVINIVNNFFHERLISLAGIRQYMESLHV